MIVFLIKRRDNPVLNVIASADGREMAKRMAVGILRGNPDQYIVTPITEHGSRTILMVAAEVVER
jgi:hypothetical protein